MRKRLLLRRGSSHRAERDDEHTWIHIKMTQNFELLCSLLFTNGRSSTSQEACARCVAYMSFIDYQIRLQAANCELLSTFSKLVTPNHCSPMSQSRKRGQAGLRKSDASACPKRPRSFLPLAFIEPHLNLSNRACVLQHRPAETGDEPRFLCIDLDVEREHAHWQNLTTKPLLL